MWLAYCEVLGAVVVVVVVLGAVVVVVVVLGAVVAVCHLWQTCCCRGWRSC